MPEKQILTEGVKITNEHGEGIQGNNDRTTDVYVTGWLSHEKKIN